MMQQKIVMKVHLSSEKLRTKALKIAAVAKGVSKVSIDAEKEQREVNGDGVDSMRLTMSLRKKLGHATKLSVEEVKGKTDEKKPTTYPITWTSRYIQYPQHPPHHHVVHDQYPQETNCSIM
ncbi:heavy metal-associated isoprenylated plant protein 41-like [Pyrus x bretschneideri]|uniref:heavy metal-associated isoprenylated plant protein 41-like n=1 Tax=Pyrus x bretschneideri TaxID=225117 RepID=UPI00202F4767|nr:heavy metal-associated isoprenylated plant protein 41-like [Pyrus x bretschneideri]